MFHDVLKMYLEECGYSTVYERPKEVTTTAEEDWIPFDEIPRVGDEEYEAIVKAINGRKATAEQRYAYLKRFFLMRVVKEDLVEDGVVDAKT